MEPQKLGLAILSHRCIHRYWLLISITSQARKHSIRDWLNAKLKAYQRHRFWPLSYYDNVISYYATLTSGDVFRCPVKAGSRPLFRCRICSRIELSILQRAARIQHRFPFPRRNHRYPAKYASNSYLKASYGSSSSRFCPSSWLLRVTNQNKSIRSTCQRCRSLNSRVYYNRPLSSAISLKAIKRTPLVYSFAALWKTLGDRCSYQRSLILHTSRCLLFGDAPQGTGLAKEIEDLWTRLATSARGVRGAIDLQAHYPEKPGRVWLLSWQDMSTELGVSSVSPSTWSRKNDDSCNFSIVMA